MWLGNVNIVQEMIIAKTLLGCEVENTFLFDLNWVAIVTFIWDGMFLLQFWRHISEHDCKHYTQKGLKIQGQKVIKVNISSIPMIWVLFNNLKFKLQIAVGLEKSVFTPKNDEKLTWPNILIKSQFRIYSPKSFLCSLCYRNRSIHSKVMWLWYGYVYKRMITLYLFYAYRSFAKFPYLFVVWISNRILWNRKVISCNVKVTK